MRKLALCTILPLVLSGCSAVVLLTPRSVQEQATIRGEQLLNSTMPADYSPILLPNSGSQVIRSVVGQKHILQLVSNPSTGYRWDYDYKEPVRGCLEIVGRNLEYDESEKYSDGLKMPGAPGKQQWLIKTNCEGTYRITFIYKRPWEQGPPLYQSTTVINTYKQ